MIIEEKIATIGASGSNNANTFKIMIDNATHIGGIAAFP